MIVLAWQIRHLFCMRLAELVFVGGVVRLVGVKCRPRPDVPTKMDADTTDCDDDDALDRRVSMFAFTNAVWHRTIDCSFR